MMSLSRSQQQFLINGKRLKFSQESPIIPWLQCIYTQTHTHTQYFKPITLQMKEPKIESKLSSIMEIRIMQLFSSPQVVNLTIIRLTIKPILSTLYGFTDL